MLRNKAFDIFKSYLIITLGSLVYAIGFNWCYVPNHIGFGGITGIGQIVNAIFPWAPIGVVVILLNVPLFLLGWKLLGGHLLISSLYAMATSSLFIDGLTALYTAFPQNPLLATMYAPMDPFLATIFGGILMGLPLGIIFQQGATTGGTDLIARLVKIKLAWLPMGQLLLVIDMIVIVLVAITFKNLSTALYGMVSLYLSSFVMDKVLYGMDSAKVAYIISEKPEEITKFVIEDLDRGVTVLPGLGGYSGDPKKVLLCAFKQRQIVTLKKTIKDIDPAAFLIVCDAHEVLGDGFRQYQQNDL
ncbi:MAG: YitT family protein [Oscillospiraceae bacterium]